MDWENNAPLQPPEPPLLLCTYGWGGAGPAGWLAAFRRPDQLLVGLLECYGGMYGVPRCRSVGGIFCFVCVAGSGTTQTLVKRRPHEGNVTCEGAPR